MNSITNRINYTFIKTALVVAVFGLSFLATNNANAAVDTVVTRVKNKIHTTEFYSAANDYDTQVRAEPGDILGFRMLYSSLLTGAPATTITTTLPADLTFSGNAAASGATLTNTQTSGQTIIFTFTSSTFVIITFDATVASGQNLSTNHALPVNYSTNGNPASSDTATIKTGPIIKSITPVTWNSTDAVDVTLKGHGFTLPSDIDTIVLSPGAINIIQPGALSVTEPDGNGLYTITGLRVDAGTPGGTYYIILTTKGFGGVTFPLSNKLSTEANSAESASYIVDLGNPVITSYSASQTGNAPDKAKAGAVVFTATFDEALSIVPKIAINQPGTTDLPATNMTLVSGNTYNYTYTVQSATGGTYIDGSATVTISNAADLAGNVMTPADHTIVIDTTKPTVAGFQIAQGINTAGTVKAGASTITVTLSEAVTTVPKIAINQPGSADISATDMTPGAGLTFTYNYTVGSANGGTYVDGPATVTVSIATDSFGNVMDVNSANTFTINTVSPFVANYTINQGANTSGYVKAGASTITITMSEAVTTAPKIAINQPGSTDISAIDMTSAGGNVYTYTYTVVAPDGSTYLDGTATITISAAATDIALGGNIMSDSLHTFVIDNVKPTITLTSVTQGTNTSGSVKVGSAVITITANETLSVVPKIAIDQPGGTDISATDMTFSSGNIYTYTYSVNSANGGTYIDGSAAITVSIAADRAGNVMDDNSANTFVIDTTAPTPGISTLAAPTSTPTEIALTWTPTYTAADFSVYKIYYRPNSSVDSSTGTLVSVGNSATTGTSITGLASGANYFLAIYICDLSGNCSDKSNEVSRSTGSSGSIIIVPSGGGGGGGGGGSTPSAPSTASSAGTITSSGGSITTTVSGGSSATVSVPANSFSASSSVTVAEATSAEKSAASIAPSAGVIIPNTVFNIQASSAFSQPITLEFVYDPAQLGSIDPNTLSISYFSATDNKWISLPSSVNTTTHKVSAQTTHFTLFAITTVPTASGSTTTNTTPPTTPPAAPPEGEPGQVLGSSIGVYPNGTLLKAPNSPAIWYIGNDKKHAIPSPAVFASRFNWSDIIRLPSSRQLDLYDQGENVKFAANTLVKEAGSSAVYRVSVAGGVQPIVSMDVFLKRFYQISDIAVVPAGALASYPREASIADSGTIYSGELVAVPQKGVLAPVYYIDNGEAREFLSRNIFDSYALKLKRIRAITAQELKTFAIAKPMPYPDGTLLKGSKPAVYIISNGKKQAFYSGADLDALLYNRKRIRRVTDAFLAQIESASPIRLVQKDIHAASIAE